VTWKASTSGASRRSCDRCGAAVLRQEVGHRAALKVIADADLIPREQAMALREPNRLVWCVAVLHGGVADLRWRCWHDCTHGAVIEHRCPAGVAQYGRRPEGAMW